MKKEINPIPIIVVALLAVAALGYFFFIRPGQVDSKIVKEWTTEEAASQRGPGKPKNAEHETVVQQLRQKEGATGVNRRNRRDDN